MDPEQDVRTRAWINHCCSYLLNLDPVEAHFVAVMLRPHVAELHNVLNELDVSSPNYAQQLWSEGDPNGYLDRVLTTCARICHETSCFIRDSSSRATMPQPEH